MLIQLTKYWSRLDTLPGNLFKKFVAINPFHFKRISIHSNRESISKFIQIIQRNGSSVNAFGLLRDQLSLYDFLSIK
ncbi:MAG: hypothetical protein DWP98_09465 [Bacteroidetes bacterium]|nr:MAG: hypothetical protein DWP98_09465 [Bacteroidota bacterium]MBL1143513.1 hypothetical protein [Bacteroidota bacterium]